MKREIAILIALLIGLLLSIFIPQSRLINHILIGIYSSTFIIILLIFLCLNDKINKWFY